MRAYCEHIHDGCHDMLYCIILCFDVLLFKNILLLRLFTRCTKENPTSVNWNVEVNTTILAKVQNSLILITDIELLYSKL